MTSAPLIKPSSKAIQAYYDALSAYKGQGVGHETAIRSAFQNLLAETARARSWTLVPELTMKVKGKAIRPDGTLRDDEWRLPRGFWEAKDTDDDHDAEIRKKVGKGYPLLNTIFEDSRRGVLFQNGREVLRAGLDDRDGLADLLNQFYGHTEKDIEGFEQAVAEFKDCIPHLAGALLEKIRGAHRPPRQYEGWRRPPHPTSPGPVDGGPASTFGGAAGPGGCVLAAAMARPSSDVTNVWKLNSGFGSRYSPRSLPSRDDMRKQAAS